MKVKFIGQETSYKDLTVGQVYRVIGLEADDYRLVNDVGRPYLYSPELFEIVDAAEPDDWQMEYGAEGERYAYPPALNRVGFFEDYFDGDEEAIAVFQQHLRQVALVS